MLTPKHRALFAAAYSAQLLRSPRDEDDAPVATSQPLAAPDTSDTDRQDGPRPTAA